MVCFKSTFLQCFVCLILLWWPAFIDSFPSSKNLALNSNNHGRRFQRDDNSGTVFSVGEDLDLVLQNDFLEFEICCNKNGGCHPGNFLFCFQTTEQKQTTDGLFGCGAGTCAYKIKYDGVDSYGLSGGRFTTSDTCFKGKIDNEKVYATYSTGDVNSFGCPLNITYGNRLKIEVKSIPSNVVVKALNAQKYVEPTLPPPTPPPPTAASELPTKKSTPPYSSTADSSNTLWIVIGVVSGILGIALLIGLGCLIYHRCIKKKSTAAAAVAKVDGKKIQISTETKTITEVQTPTVKQETEKAVEEKEDEKKSGVEKVTKEETKEPKPKKKKASKQKSKKQKKKEGKEKKKVAPTPARKAPTPNRTKPTQEETPPNAAEPAFIDTTATSLAAPKPPAAPNLCVLDKIIVPQRSHESSNHSNSKSRKSGSISGHQDLNMQMIVENPSQALARFFDNSDLSSNDKKVSEAKMQEIKDFYPVGKKAREFKHEEISILCCYRISTMFDKIETMRTTAKKKLQDHGAVFDQNGCIVEMPPGTLYYVQNRATAEYIRAFAFGALFYQEIDRYTPSQVVMSIPLLFSLILQPRYPVLQRRKACVWIRRQLPIIFKEYSLVELGRLAYPICAMKKACFENRSGFYTTVLHTETKDEIEPPPSSYRPKGKLIEYNPNMDKNVIF